MNRMQEIESNMRKKRLAGGEMIMGGFQDVSKVAEILDTSLCSSTCVSSCRRGEVLLAEGGIERTGIPASAIPTDLRVHSFAVLHFRFDCLPKVSGLDSKAPIVSASWLLSA
eukprot:756574-Hanusia_phi.AAC.3